MNGHSEQRSVNSRRLFLVGVSDASVAAAAPTETPFANRHVFFCNAARVLLLQTRRAVDTLVPSIERNTYAESQNRSATKPGIG